MHQQHVNYLINTWILSVKTLLFKECDTAFYAIIVVYRLKYMTLFHPKRRHLINVRGVFKNTRIDAAIPSVFD